MFPVIAFLSFGLRQSVPLIFASLGGVCSERSGVVNIGLEGMMLTGAFVSIAVANATGSVVVGVLAAIAAGGLLGGLHALVTVTFKADQIVSGVAINLLAMGLTAFIPEALYGRSDIGSECPVPTIAGFTPLVFLAIAAVVVAHLALFKTSWGLRLRSVGENPEAADSLGISVTRMRYYGVILSGALAALGGVYLSLDQSGSFYKVMTGGKGFIALAAMIFGNWTPFGALGASMLFGFADAAQGQVQLLGYAIPPQIPQMIPYILTIAVLAGFVGRALPPAADGKPYEK